MSDSDEHIGPSAQHFCGPRLQLGPQASMETIPGSEPVSARPLKKRHMFNYLQVLEEVGSHATPGLHPTATEAINDNCTEVDHKSALQPTGHCLPNEKLRSTGCNDGIQKHLPALMPEVDLAEAVKRVLSSKGGSTPRIKLSKPRQPAKSVQQTLSIDRSKGPAIVRLSKPRSPHKSNSPHRPPRKSEGRGKPRSPKKSGPITPGCDAEPIVDVTGAEHLHTEPNEEGWLTKNQKASPAMDQHNSKLSKIDIDIDIEMLTYYPPQGEEEEQGQGSLNGALEQVENGNDDNEDDNDSDDGDDDIFYKSPKKKRTRKVSARDEEDEDEDPAFKPSRKLKKAVKVSAPRFEVMRRRSGRQK